VLAKATLHEHDDCASAVQAGSQELSGMLACLHLAQVLMILGFLACRKHHDRILLLVKLMAKSGLPCYKTGVWVCSGRLSRTGLVGLHLHVCPSELG
jgi:hypothetical protein